MKKTRILTALILSATMGLTACGGGDSSKETSNKEKSSDGEKVLKTYFSDTPQTLNPHTTADNYELLLDMSATLYREVWDEETGAKTYVASLADGDPVCNDDEHKVWTIKVKDGYTFADGTEINAETVEYSIKMLNDPKLANRNVNATNFENGDAYLKGECDWEEVGFQAVDENTLEVTYAKNYEPESERDVKDLFCFVGTALVKPELYESCLNEDKTECSYGSSLETFMASALYDV